MAAKPPLFLTSCLPAPLRHSVLIISHPSMRFLVITVENSYRILYAANKGLMYAPLAKTFCTLDTNIDKLHSNNLSKDGSSTISYMLVDGRYGANKLNSTYWE